MRRALLLTALLVVAGCKNTTDPYLTEQHCRRWDSEVSYVPMVIGDQWQVMPMPSEVCTGGWDVTTRLNPDYVPPR